MAFQGELYSVSYDNIEVLESNGPDVIFIEKEGIVEKLIPFTTDPGIALVHSQGFYSEYAEMLANKVIAWRGNVGVYHIRSKQKYFCSRVRSSQFLQQ